MIALSRAAAQDNPALATWLSGAGLAPTLFDAAEAPAASPAIYAAREADRAAPRDLLVDFTDRDPTLILAEDAPTLIRFGYDLKLLPRQLALLATGRARFINVGKN